MGRGHDQIYIYIYMSCSGSKGLSVESGAIQWKGTLW
jgi:hypothetical protein